MEKRKVFYGWYMTILLAFLYLISTGSLGTTASIMNPLMAADLGMSATEVGTGFSVLLLVYGIGAPAAGYAVAKIGARTTHVLGGALLILASLLMFFFVQEVVLYTICLAIFSFGTLCAGQINAQSSVGVWFHKRRGMAMMLLLTLGGMGTFIAPLITNAIVNAMGAPAVASAWRYGWLFFLVAGIVIVVLALLFVKNKPEDIGEVPDGRGAPDKQEKARRVSKVFKETDSVSYKNTVRTRAYWLIVIVGAIGFLTYALSTSLAPAHFGELGVDRNVVVAGVSAMGFAIIPGRIIIGGLSDRIEPVRLMGFCMALITFGVFVGAGGSSPVLAVGYFVIVGFGYGGVAACLPTTVANYFGPDDFSKNLGTTMLLAGLASSSVPIIGGVIHDASGSYVPVFYGVAVLMAAGALIGLFLVRFPKKKQTDEASASLEANTIGEA